MDFLQVFENAMENSATFALATSQDNSPNVRIITFYYNAENKGIVYFPTLKQSPKTMEIAQNNKIAFTTIPNGPCGVVRVKNATIQKSKHSINDIKDGITKKFAGFGAMVENVGHIMEVYEIHFKEATVTANHDNIDTVTF